MTAAILSLSAVRKRFGERAVLDGVDLTIAPGELIAIVGPSGCGKTTLLNVMSGMDGAFEGSATLFGKPLAGLPDDARAGLRNELLGFVFQSFHLLEHLTVQENVKVPLWLAHASSLPAAEEDARASQALSRVGLAERAHEKIGPLSGGERQRVAIARAVVNRPRLVLADEPTGNLDADTGASIVSLFDEIRRHESGCAVVVVTHDPRIAKRADRVLKLSKGRLEPGVAEAVA